MREALLAVIGTIAASELSATSIIDAETLKLSTLTEMSLRIDDEDKAAQLLVDADKSVSALVDHVAEYEASLQRKLRTASKNISKI